MHAVLALIALLIIYGSLYPFHYEAGAAGWQDVLDLLAQLDTRTGLGNLLANIVLFVPYAFVAVMAAEGSRWRRTLVWVYMGLGLALALLLQVAQLWLPGRNPAMGDAAINAVGLALGWALAAGLRRVTGDARGSRAPVEWSLPIVLAVLWVAYRWFPLVPTLDLENVSNALKPLFLTPDVDPVRSVASAVSWMVWMWLLLRTPLQGRPWWWIAAVAILVVGLQPLFMFNTISVANVIGLAIALVSLPWLRHQAAGTVLCITLLGLLLVLGLQPFRLAASPNAFGWLPFEGYLGGSMSINILNLLYKSFLYGAAVYMLHANGMRWRNAGLWLAAWLGMIEVTQIWIATRTAEITDPLMALLIAFAMSRYEGRVRRFA